MTLIYSPSLTDEGVKTRKNEIVEGFRRQGAFCSSHGAKLTAAIITACGDDIEAGGPLFDLVKNFIGEPEKGALALRCAGALHWLHLKGRADGLTDAYMAPDKDWSSSDLYPAISQLALNEADVFECFISNAPQTNEVRRTAVLLFGFSKIAQQTGMPLDLFELGASGGLLLAWDQFQYEYGSFSWGMGRPLITAEWRGDAPDLAHSIAVGNRRGCDLNPMDLSDEEQLLKANAYIWPEDKTRLKMFKEAIWRAESLDMKIDKANAVDWLEATVSSCKEGVATVVYNSIFSVYLSDDDQRRLDASTEAIAKTATETAPFARLTFEMEETDQGQQFFLDLQTWPGAVKTRLAKAHHHGAWIEPMAGCA